jgi:uncharacterized protein YdaU (DUF1376 family)
VSEFFWTPVEWEAYDRKTAHLSLAQDGAYRRLLSHYYQTRKPLPAIAEVLLRVCRAFDDTEKAAVTTVVDEFFVLEEDGYHNRRADEELAKQAQLSEKRRDAGKKGAQSTNGKRAAIAPANGAANERQLPTQLQSQLHKEELKTLEREAEEIYSIYPRKVGKSDALKAIRKAIARELKNHPQAAEYLKSRTLQFAKSDAGNRGEFTPHPSTWFNGSRYNDDEREWQRADAKPIRSGPDDSWMVYDPNKPSVYGGER